MGGYKSQIRKPTLPLDVTTSVTLKAQEGPWGAGHGDRPPPGRSAEAPHRGRTSWDTELRGLVLVRQGLRLSSRCRTKAEGPACQLQVRSHSRDHSRTLPSSGDLTRDERGGSEAFHTQPAPIPRPPVHTRSLWQPTPPHLAQAPEASELGHPAKNLSSITAFPFPGSAGRASTGNPGPVCLKIARILGGLPSRSSLGAFCLVSLPGPRSVRESLPSLTEVPQGCLQGWTFSSLPPRDGLGPPGQVEWKWGQWAACLLPGPLGKASASPHFP